MYLEQLIESRLFFEDDVAIKTTKQHSAVDDPEIISIDNKTRKLYEELKNKYHDIENVKESEIIKITDYISKKYDEVKIGDSSKVKAVIQYVAESLRKDILSINEYKNYFTNFSSNPEASLAFLYLKYQELIETNKTDESHFFTSIKKSIGDIVKDEKTKEEVAKKIDGIKDSFIKEMLEPIYKKYEPEIIKYRTALGTNIEILKQKRQIDEIVDIKSKRQTASSAKIKELSLTLEKKEKEIKALNKEIDQLKQKASTIPSKDKTIIQLEKEKAELEKEKARLQKELDEKVKPTIKKLIFDITTSIAYLILGLFISTAGLMAKNYPVAEMGFIKLITTSIQAIFKTRFDIYTLLIIAGLLIIFASIYHFAKNLWKMLLHLYEKVKQYFNSK